MTNLRLPLLLALLLSIFTLTPSALAEPISSAPQVQINSATAEQLANTLNGIGLAKAEAIVEYRIKHGPFKNADDLIQVKGIGEGLVKRNQALIAFDLPKTSHK